MKIIGWQWYIIGWQSIPRPRFCITMLNSGKNDELNEMKIPFNRIQTRVDNVLVLDKQ